MSYPQRFRVGVVIAGMLAAALFSSPSAAISLSPAVYSLGVLNPTDLGIQDPGPFTASPSLGVGSLSNTYCDTPTSTICATSTATMNAPSMSASGTSNGAAGGAYASAEIIYFYEIVGPSNITVPMQISGSISTAVIGTYGENSTAWINYSASDGNAASRYNGQLGFNFSACSSTTTNYCSNNGYTQSSGTLNASPFHVVANTQQFVYLLAQGAVNYNGASYNGIGSFSSTVDPMVNIDPTFLASNPDYSLVFSSNVSTVPLPGTDWLFGSGLLGLASMARRRRI